MPLPYPMNKAELERQTAAAKLALDMAERHHREITSIKVECASCEHYHARRCTKWQASPPPDVLAVGCEEWTFDEIPF